MVVRPMRINMAIKSTKLSNDLHGQLEASWPSKGLSEFNHLSGREKAELMGYVSQPGAIDALARLAGEPRDAFADPMAALIAAIEKGGVEGARSLLRSIVKR